MCQKIPYDPDAFQRYDMAAAARRRPSRPGRPSAKPTVPNAQLRPRQLNQMPERSTYQRGVIAPASVRDRRRESTGLGYPSYGQFGFVIWPAAIRQPAPSSTATTSIVRPTPTVSPGHDSAVLN